MVCNTSSIKQAGLSKSSLDFSLGFPQRFVLHLIKYKTRFLNNVFQLSSEEEKIAPHPKKMLMLKNIDTQECLRPNSFD